jgi:glycosyltransferase involved in cell wall biosynthesis
MSARVVLLSTNLARGGAETQVAQLALGLRAGGWDVAVISMIPPTAFGEELRAAGVPVYSLGMKPARWNALGILRLLAILRRLRPQVLHAHMFHANLLARLVRMVCPVPVVISTLHSVAESGRSSRNVRWRDLAYRLTDPFGDVVVAVAEAVAVRHRTAHVVPRHKLRLIPNGVDTSHFCPDAERRERVRRSLGLGGEFVWLAAGRLIWKKGYDTLLAAFAQCPEGTLLIAGAGPLEDELRGSAPERVRFLGQRDDVADLMRACDGFVQASVIEGLPVALLEAGASGLACVATGAGGTAEAGFAELVEPGDVTSLASTMQRVSSMSEEARRQMGLATRERVIACFDSRAVLAQWEQLYRERLSPWM